MTARVCTPNVREIVIVFQRRHSVTVQFPNALLAHARPTMFYIPLVISWNSRSESWFLATMTTICGFDKKYLVDTISKNWLVFMFHLQILHCTNLESPRLSCNRLCIHLMHCRSLLPLVWTMLDPGNWFVHTSRPSSRTWCSPWCVIATRMTSCGTTTPMSTFDSSLVNNQSVFFLVNQEPGRIASLYLHYCC